MVGVIQLDEIRLGSNADLVLDVERNDTGALTAPSGTPTISIYDPNNTLDVNGATMTLEVVGRYVYNYQTATSDVPGTYKAVVSLEVATGRTEITVMTFKVR